MAQKKTAAKKTTTSKAAAKTKLEQPKRGGSFIREPDGSLNQVERTAPAPVRTAAQKKEA